MVKIYFTSSETHNKDSHVENKLRITIPEKFLRDIFDDSCINKTNIIEEIEFIDLVELAQGNSVLQNIYNSNSKNCNGYWYVNGGDTYFTTKLKDNLIELVSNLKDAVNNILEEKYHYMLIRPPGHHCFNKATGFCPLNNVFIMATYAKSVGYKKIFILDWDYHAGDGTAGLVKDKEGFFFVSIHAVGTNNFPVYPMSYENEDYDNVKNFPIKLTKPNDKYLYRDSYYMSLLTIEINEHIKSFEPDLIIISNGLDAHKDDTLEGLNLTDEFYVEATKYLKSLEVPLIFCLEGGYNPNVIREVSHKIINELNV